MWISIPIAGNPSRFNKHRASIRRNLKFFAISFISNILAIFDIKGFQISRRFF